MQGSYAEICTSGCSAPRLYGLWTGEWAPEWRSAYTLDANVNLQVAPMNVANLSYSQLGYINFVLRNAPDWMENAEASYGIHDGLMTGINSDGDRCMSIEYDNNYPFCYWNAGASWCLMPLFEYWQCFGNKTIPINDYMRIENCRKVLGINDGGLSNDEMDELIKKGELDLERDILLPLLTKQTNFWEQLCTPEYYTDGNGNMRYEKGKESLKRDEKYLILPGYSPENYPLGRTSRLGGNVTMDISAAKYGLDMTIALEKSIKRQGYEKAVKKWELLKSQLPDYKTDIDGALCEWSAGGYAENNNHRHISHLYPAWPAYETKSDEALKQSVIKALKNRESMYCSNATSGHGWLHRALVETRLGHAEKAEVYILKMAAGDAYFTSMMTDHDSNRRHNSYCTDMSIDFTAVVLEMLFFSDTDKLELMPAMLKSWEKGVAKGFASRCMVMIEEMKWDIESGVIASSLASLKDNNDIEFSCGIKCREIIVSGSEYNNGHIYFKNKNDTANMRINL